MFSRKALWALVVVAALGAVALAGEPAAPPAGEEGDIFDELKALAQRDCLPGYRFTEADYWAMRTPLANAVRLAHPDSPLTDELAQAWLREGGALRMGEDGNGVPTTPVLITKAAAPEAE